MVYNNSSGSVAAIIIIMNGDADVEKTNFCISFDISFRADRLCL